jgi:starch-binding outer membrane protein, SusD/RagB family
MLAIMTKKIFYITMLFAASVAVSCSDDMLEKKPLDSYSEVDVFRDASLLRNFVNGTYVGIRHSFDDENSLLDGLTDNAYNRHGSGEATRGYTQATTTVDNGEGVTRNLWTNAYAYIRRPNLFFEKTENAAIPTAGLEPLAGEMYFIRVYLYFDLMRWYGGVPVITRALDLDEPTFEMSRNSVEEVVALIVADCDNAIAKLPAFADQEKGRASKEAAMALKGRALLYAASPLFNPTNDPNKWTAARDANKALMDLKTIPFISAAAEYGEVFNGGSEKEIIFARYFTVFNNQGWGVNTWLYSGSFGGWSNTTPTQDLVDSYELINGKVPADPTSGYNPQDPYVNRDPRFAESILYQGATFTDATTKAPRAMEYFFDKANPSDRALAGKDSPFSSSGGNNSLTGYNFRKYTDEGKKGEGVGGEETNTNPFIFFRITEAYLNYAEAQIALGNEDEAQAALTEIRARVGMPAVTEAGAQLTERYRRERRIELVLEDHRFFDIRRWKIGPEALNKPAKGVNVYKNGSTIEFDYNYTVDPLRKWDDKLYLLPIPPSEIRRSNNKLEQNGGYL